MTKSRPRRLITSRDVQILTALWRTPLTALQLLSLSESFEKPFGSDRRVRSRMQMLGDAGLVNRFAYATADRSAPGYYKLTGDGFGALFGPDAKPPSKRFFDPVGVSREHHTRSLADVIVQMSLSAHRTNVTLRGFYPENAIRLPVGDEVVIPDCSFQLVTNLGGQFNFFVEVDNHSESIRSETDRNAWSRKVRLYEALQDLYQQRFRVLVITTRSTDRLAHILDVAREGAGNQARRLFYGISLPALLDASDLIMSPCFTDHFGKPATLIAPLRSVAVGQRRLSKVIP